MWTFSADNDSQRDRAAAEAVRNWLADRAGRTAVQIGGCGHDCLPGERFLETYCLDTHRQGVDVCSELAALPLMSEKVDLVVMMHSMDRHGARNEWMSEAARVLRPEGQLIVVGRYLWPNTWLRPGKMPLGAWALRGLVLRHGLQWEGVQRLKPLSGVYVASARRRMFGLRPLTPHWRRKRAASRSLEVPGAGRAG